MQAKTVIMRHKITDVLLKYAGMGLPNAGTWVSTKVLIDCMGLEGDNFAKSNAASEIGNMLMDGLIERKRVQGKNYWKLTIDGVISELESYFDQ